MMIRLMLAVLSAALLIASFPNFNLWPFAWIGLLPLFFSLDGGKPLRAFAIAYLTGATFFLGTVNWLIHVTFPGMIALALYLAIYFGVFGFIASHFLKHPSYLSLFVVPSAWVAVEYARSHLLGGFGWNLLAYSQGFNLPIIQIADITGAYGVSFLIVLVNTAIFFTIKDLRRKNYHTFYLAVTIALVFIATGYGIFRLKNIFTGRAIKVCVVQGNIPQDKKWNSGFRSSIMERYAQLTTAASKYSPDLVIWPETSVPGFIQEEPELLDEVKALAKGSRAHLLVGSPRSGPGSKGGETYYNSALLFDKDGNEIAAYDKLHLVPFGEFIPGKGIFSFVEKFAKSTIGDFSRGNEYKVFKFFVERSQTGEKSNWRLVMNVRFSTLICFEDIFPHIARRFVKDGAGFLVNITNDAWFGRSSAPYQHLQNSIYRAVENRVNVVRAANTGVSCFIDQKGRVTGKVESGGKDIFVEGYKIEGMVLTPTRTIYTKLGNVFAYICILITILFFAINSRLNKFINHLLS